MEPEFKWIAVLLGVVILLDVLGAFAAYGVLRLLGSGLGMWGAAGVMVIVLAVWNMTAVITGLVVADAVGTRAEAKRRG